MPIVFWGLYSWMLALENTDDVVVSGLINSLLLENPHRLSKDPPP
jgi:hypothetical protein